MASGGCLGFEGSRPRRPFRLSVRTTVEKQTRDKGRGEVVLLTLPRRPLPNPKDHRPIPPPPSLPTRSRLPPTGPPGVQPHGPTVGILAHTGLPGDSTLPLAALDCGPDTHLPSPCPQPGTSGSGRTGSGSAASCPQGSPCSPSRCTWRFSALCAGWGRGTTRNRLSEWGGAQGRGPIQILLPWQTKAPSVRRYFSNIWVARKGRDGRVGVGSGEKILRDGVLETSVLRGRPPRTGDGDPTVLTPAPS